MNDPIAKHAEWMADIIQEKVRTGKAKMLSLYEICQAVGTFSGRQEKADVLINNSSAPLRELLRVTYDPNIQFVVTSDEVREAGWDSMDIPDYDMAGVQLFEAARRLASFTNERKPNAITPKLAIKNLTEMFSAMHPDEVDLVLQAMDKKIKVDGLTEKRVRSAFPGLLSEAK